MKVVTMDGLEIRNIRKIKKRFTRIIIIPQWKNNDESTKVLNMNKRNKKNKRNKNHEPLNEHGIENDIKTAGRMSIPWHQVKYIYD